MHRNRCWIRFAQGTRSKSAMVRSDSGCGLPNAISAVSSSARSKIVSWRTSRTALAIVFVSALRMFMTSRRERTKSLTNPSSNFLRFRMSWINLAAMNYALEYEAETATQRIVLFELAYHSEERGYTWPSSKFIAIRWRLDRGTVRRQIKALIGRRAIFNTKKRRGNTRQIKVYRMPKFTWERGSQSTPLSDGEGGRKRGIRGAKGGHSHPRTMNKEQRTDDDDSKALGNSLAGEQPNHKSSSSSFSNIEEAMKHPRWKKFDAYCEGSPTDSPTGSPTLQGFNTWLSRQAPLKPKQEPKRNGPRLNFEAELKASKAKADRDNGLRLMKI